MKIEGLLIFLPMPGIEIVVLTDKAGMLDCFCLIRQLNPGLLIQEYESLLDEMLKQGYRQAVAVMDGKKAGVCGYWINTKIYSGKYVELDNVVVDENRRGMKIGEMLCAYVIDLAMQQNCRVAMLDAYIENEKAHTFYERMGFNKKGFHFVKKL
jgi:ribosomal protein S18 acetylase RimI-like enzyme